MKLLLIVAASICFIIWQAGQTQKKAIGVDSTYRLRAREKPTNDKRAHTYGMGKSLTVSLV